MTKPQLFFALKYDDAPRAMEFLEAIGFARVSAYLDPADPRVVHHAEFRWRDNGGLMLGSKRSGTEAFDTNAAGCYLVLERAEDVDELHRKALAAGATSTYEPREEDYGGRGAGVADFEGNLFSFGSYPGAEA